jgi:hypothetical protein
MRANPDEEYYLLESRVRENRMHGSVGGEDGRPPLPNHGKRLQENVARMEHSLMRSVDKT